jgi:type IV fimbrial biogenesis protein FimT
MKPNRTLHKIAGFTLVELMVTLAIATIVMTTAVPSFSTMIKNNSLATQTNSLVTDINLARSEAVKRGTRVILCRSADPNAATPACGGGANTWTTGWLVFASGDANNTYTAGIDTLIRIGKPTGSSITIKTNSTSNNNLEYNSNGTTNEGGGTAIFAVCDDRDESYGRQIQVDPRGRPRLITGTTADPIPDCTTPTAA